MYRNITIETELNDEEFKELLIYFQKPFAERKKNFFIKIGRLLYVETNKGMQPAHPELIDSLIKLLNDNKQFRKEWGIKEKIMPHNIKIINEL
jgi:hypothetical protein